LHALQVKYVIAGCILLVLRANIATVFLSVSLSLYVSVCLPASISLETLDQSSQNFACRSPWPWLSPPLTAL